MNPLTSAKVTSTQKRHQNPPSPPNSPQCRTNAATEAKKKENKENNDQINENNEKWKAQLHKEKREMINTAKEQAWATNKEKTHIGKIYKNA